MVDAAGDVNGDGFGDVVVGAWADGEFGALSGAAYLYCGSQTGLDASSPLRITASDAREDALFGASVTAADLNGDGYSDVLIGAVRDDEAGMIAGAAYVYFGSAAGWTSPTPSCLSSWPGAGPDSLKPGLRAPGDHLRRACRPLGGFRAA